MRRISQILFIFGLTLFTGWGAFSQTILQPEPPKALEQSARERTEIWEDELSLTAKQMSLMEDKFVEFGLKRNKLLQSKMREEAKTRRLLELQVLENRDMRDILTKPQFDRYIFLQKRSQKKQKPEN